MARGTGVLTALTRAFVGTPIELPPALRARWPGLAEVRWRRGGLPPRVGGWCLGARSVAAITLWRTVFLAPDTRLAPRLLLHELRHVQHFRSGPLFPLRYAWESLRRGYAGNRYETDADTFAWAQLHGVPTDPPHQDV